MLAEGLKLPEALAILYRNAGPVSRRKALAKAAQYLLQVNRKRIRANVTPEGAAMAARTDAWKGKMFPRLPEYLQRWLQNDLAQVGFSGRMGWVASNHQFGRSVAYPHYTSDLPVRELLGINAEDAEHIKAIVLQQLMEGVK
jgi:phage virion morphogenesis protein